MAKSKRVRDYAVEYARRLKLMEAERGGYSRAQARGHARRTELSVKEHAQFRREPAKYGLLRDVFARSAEQRGDLIAAYKDAKKLEANPSTKDEGRTLMAKIRAEARARDKGLEPHYYKGLGPTKQGRRQRKEDEDFGDNGELFDESAEDYNREFGGVDDDDGSDGEHTTDRI